MLGGWPDAVTVGVHKPFRNGQTEHIRIEYMGATCWNGEENGSRADVGKERPRQIELSIVHRTGL